MQYQVIVTNGLNEMDEKLSTSDINGDAWTAESAVRFAHVDGARMVPNTWIRIARRRGPRSEWVMYRAYTVGEDGIARRTDR